MSDVVLEAYIRQTIAGQNAPEISFAWQGGEPTRGGVGFFRKVVALQRQYARGRRICNSLETDGLALDEAWCGFLAEHRFHVCLRVDGVSARQSGDGVMRAVERLKRNGVGFGTVTLVGRQSSREPERVYRFLKEVGSERMRFDPLVEWMGSGEVTPRSVAGVDYGKFLGAIFDEWVRCDVGRYCVEVFDVMLGMWCGAEASWCVFSERCGNAVAVGHNGDVFSCDRYADAEHRLGNLLEMPLRAMVDSAGRREFLEGKVAELPERCGACEFLTICHGGCPRDRRGGGGGGDAGVNHLCEGYRWFFRHIDPYMRMMADLLEKNRPAKDIMEMLVARAVRI